MRNKILSFHILWEVPKCLCLTGSSLSAERESTVSVTHCHGGGSSACVKGRCRYSEKKINFCLLSVTGWICVTWQEACFEMLGRGRSKKTVNLRAGAGVLSLDPDGLSGCRAASLAPSCCVPAGSPSGSGNHRCSRHCQMSPGRREPLGAQPSVGPLF